MKDFIDNELDQCVGQHIHTITKTTLSTDFVHLQITLV